MQTALFTSSVPRDLRRFARELLDRREVAAFEQLLRHHPASAAADDVFLREVRRRIPGDSRRRSHERHTAVRAKALEHRDAADDLRRKELDEIQPHAHAGFHLRGVAQPGITGTPILRHHATTSGFVPG